jgi:hypothetical protein
LKAIAGQYSWLPTGETTKESVMYNGLLLLKDKKGVHIIENAISFIGHRVTSHFPRLTTEDTF